MARALNKKSKKKNAPLISVVMPAHNASKHISIAIESILNQTFKNFEFIIVNDNSSDKTAKIVKKYARKDLRIRLLNNSKKLDIAGSLNRGIEDSKSNIIARMDADDISTPQRLELQYKLIQKSKKTAAVGSNIILIDSLDNVIGLRNYPVTSEKLKKCLFKYSPFAHPVVMFRKDIFEKVGKYNPKYSPTEDLDLWFRLGKKYEFKSVPKPLLKYRLSEKSSSHKMIKDLEILVFKIRMDAVFKHGYKPNLFDLIYNLFQFLTLWITPAKYRIKIYNLLRNNDII